MLGIYWKKQVKVTATTDLKKVNINKTFLVRGETI